MLKNWLCTGGAVFVLGCAAAAPAMAQTATISTPPSNNGSVVTYPTFQSLRNGVGPQVAPATPQKPQAYLFDLSGVGQSTGKSLADMGIYFNGTTTLQSISPVSGGLKNGTYFYNVNILGFGLDLQRLLGLQGSSVFFETNLQAGQTSSAGVSPTATTIFNHVTGGDEARLLELAWEQMFLQGKLKFIAGRLANPIYTLAGAFDDLPWLCSFASQSCGNAGLYGDDGAKPLYNSSSWGGVIIGSPTPHLTLKLGVFEDEPIETSDPSQNGWPGADWGLNDSQGAYIPAQIDYNVHLGPQHLPGSYFVGGFLSTAKTTDPLYNSQGELLSKHGGIGESHKSSDGMWIEGDQMVFRDHGRSLSLFASVEYGPPYQPIQQELEGGFTLGGLIPSRPLDTVNVLAEDAMLDPRYLEAENLKIKHGHLAGTTQSFELNYSAVVAPGFLLRPYIQYVKNPDEYQLPIAQKPINDMFAVGFEIVINYNQLLGLPQLGL
jgi:carbohydrate-selective porin OprB